jgi:proteasome lid subunit RPN8/RPN11
MVKTESRSHIGTQKQKLLDKRTQLLSAFVKAAEAGRQKRLTALYGKIREANEFLSALEDIEQEMAAGPPADGPKRRRYAVSSLFLHESFKKLTADQDEQFFFITGNEVDGTFVLDQWAEFAHQKRSLLGVTADTRSTHRLLIKLEQFGHRLLAHFHSHPGTGADSTHPSGTDLNYQKRLESAGHLAVMAIFSRDGFIRFVRLDQNVDIEIYGTGVERHEPGIYRLTNINQA